MAQNGYEVLFEYIENKFEFSSFRDTRQNTNRMSRFGWCLSGVSVAWMPPSRLQGDTNGVPWQVPRRPIVVKS